VDLEFITSEPHPDEMGTAGDKFYRAQIKDLKAWKRRVVEVPKNSPLKESKFLRWKVYESQARHGVSGGTLVEEGELEVLPGTTL